jgi:radical SAM protein with 4Fe4S-binding SPASM domain
MQMLSIHKLEHIDIEVNHRCNLACRHCSAQAVKRVCSNELSIPEIKKILSQGKEMGLRKVGLTGGEPLYDMKKLEAIASFCANELRVSLHIHTNGTLVAEKIRGNGRVLSLFDSISVTFLGGNAETHDYMTATKGTFDQTFNAAKVLANRGLPVSCYFIPVRNNCEGFDQLAEDLYKIGAKNIRVMALAPSGRARPIYYKTVPTKEEVEKFERSLLTKREELGLKIEAGYCTRLSIHKLSVLSGHEVCTSGVNRVHINSKGDVFPCTAASGVKELNLGNLRNNGFRLDDIWFNSERVKLIRMVHSGNLAECLECQRKPKCQFGCTVNACGTMLQEERQLCPLVK